MNNRVKCCIITGYGINSDRDLAAAFGMAGADAELVHINDLKADPDRLLDYRIIGFPGGFSFGDHLGSGLVFAQIFRKNLKSSLEAFIAGGGLIIGICNGFQVLVKMGVLPNLSGNWDREVTLVHNDCGTFIDDWVTLKAGPSNRCVWLNGIDEIELPIRHGEGRFITLDASVEAGLVEEGLDVLHYADRNPNGSVLDIAGITDRSGRILGLMPHPEAFVHPENHPCWTRRTITEGAGLRIIRNGVEYAEKH